MNVQPFPEAASRLLIHIGYHKTGTSWLQRHLFGRFDRGFFPLQYKATQETSTAKSLAKGPYKDFVYERNTVLHPLKFDAARVKERFIKEINWEKQGVPVISSERLSGNPHSGGFDSKEVACRLQQVFPDARVLICIREQHAMVLSAYYQYLKAGGTLSLAGYVQPQTTDGRYPGFSLAHFEYHHLIRHYQELYSPERVLILPYELFVSNPETFVANLCGFCNIEVPPGLEYHKYENEGLNKYIESNCRLLNLIAKKDSLNGFSPLHIKGSSVLLEKIKRSVATVIPDAVVKRHVVAQKQQVVDLVGDYYRHSNTITSQLIDADLSQHGYLLSFSGV